MTRLRKEIYRFNAISIKTQMAFFTEVEQIILKVVKKHKKTTNSKNGGVYLNATTMLLSITIHPLFNN